VNELVIMVNMALGTADESACSQGIPSGAPVDVSLIVRAVNNSLTGCPAT
jgi:hypothetical protein